jgi:hypothetical protein
MDDKFIDPRRSEDGSISWADIHTYIDLLADLAAVSTAKQSRSSLLMEV